MQKYDKSLAKTCSINSYFKSICDDDAFWIKKLYNIFTSSRESGMSIMKEYKLTDIENISYNRIKVLKDKFGFNTYRNFYKWLLRNFKFGNIIFNLS